MKAHTLWVAPHKLHDCTTENLKGVKKNQRKDNMLNPDAMVGTISNAGNRKDKCNITDAASLNFYNFVGLEHLQYIWIFTLGTVTVGGRTS